MRALQCIPTASWPRQFDCCFTQHNHRNNTLERATYFGTVLVGLARLFIRYYLLFIRLDYFIVH